MSTQYWVSVAERVAYNTSDYQTGVPALICMYLCLWCIISYFRDTRFPSPITLFLDHLWKGKKIQRLNRYFAMQGFHSQFIAFRHWKLSDNILQNPFWRWRWLFNILKCWMLTYTRYAHISQDSGGGGVVRIVCCFIHFACALRLSGTNWFPTVLGIPRKPTYTHMHLPRPCLCVHG